MDAKINVVKTHPLARIPTKDTEGSVGFSLFSVDDYVLYPNQRVTLDTGVILEIPHGMYGRIAPKSGLAMKYGIEVLGGVVDGDYRGSVGVTLYNAGDKELYIKRGYRIAQLIVERAANPCFFEILPHQLSVTLRGNNGFGSTGN